MGPVPFGESYSKAPAIIGQGAKTPLTAPPPLFFFANKPWVYLMDRAFEDVKDLTQTSHYLKIDT